MCGTVLIAVPAMETMIPMNPVRRTLLNAPLRTYCRAGAASHAGVRDIVSLLFYTGIPKRVSLPENRIYPEIKVFDLRPVNAKYDSDLSRLPRIDVRKVRLFFKDQISSLHLLLPCHRICLCGHADHFFVSGIAQNLHSAVFHQFLAEVFSSRCKK